MGSTSVPVVEHDELLRDRHFGVDPVVIARRAGSHEVLLRARKPRQASKYIAEDHPSISIMFLLCGVVCFDPSEPKGH